VTTDPTSAAGILGTSSSDASSQTATKKNELGKDAFLSLLVTQLQHQDPLQPQDNAAFLAQLAQFTSVESLEQIKSDIGSMLGLLQAGSQAVDAATAGTTAATSAATTAAVNKTSAF